MANQNPEQIKLKVNTEDALTSHNPFKLSVIIQSDSTIARLKTLIFSFAAATSNHSKTSAVFTSK
jgi:hypothetical protein